MTREQIQAAIALKLTIDDRLPEKERAHAMFEALGKTIEGLTLNKETNPQEFLSEVGTIAHALGFILQGYMAAVIRDTVVARCLVETQVSEGVDTWFATREVKIVHPQPEAVQ